MRRLVSANIIKLLLIRSLLPSTTLGIHFDSTTFCQYYYQPDHATKQCYTLKHNIQDLIDYNRLYFDSHDNRNKSMEPHNQTLKIYTNPLAQHTTYTISQPSPFSLDMNIAYDK